jgi:hypothetical protein
MAFYTLIIGLVLNFTGALLMFFNTPKGKDVTDRIKMKQRIKIGMAILVIGIILQITAIYKINYWPNTY